MVTEPVALGNLMSFYSWIRDPEDAHSSTDSAAPEWSQPKGKVSKAWKTQWRVFVRLSALCLRAPGSRIPAGGSPVGWCWTFVPLQILENHVDLCQSWQEM